MFRATHADPICDRDTARQGGYMWSMAELTRTPAHAPPLSEAAEDEGQRARRMAYEAGRIAAADASIAAGRVVSFEAICAWADSIDTPDELAPPKA
jgi:hypothetical protein